MPWFPAVMMSWVYEPAKRHNSRNTEAYQIFQLNIGSCAYKRAFLTHRNAVTIAVKRVAGMSWTAKNEKREVLRADLQRKVSLCLHNSFCRNREQKVNVDLMPCCKQRLLEQESWCWKCWKIVKRANKKMKPWNESWRRRDETGVGRYEK